MKMTDILKIKKALIEIAEKNNRPHYSLIVVREVVQAYINNTDHFLKRFVDHEISTNENITKSVNNLGESNLAKLIIFCEPRGMACVLAKNAGLTYQFLNKLLLCMSLLTDQLWIQISSAFQESQEEYSLNLNKRRQIGHGRPRKYAGGCRCDDCVGMADKGMVAA